MNKLNRLTEKNPNWFDDELWSSACEPDDEMIDGVYRKLKEYEDAEDQERIVVLPCAVGDTIYRVWYTPCHNGNDLPDSMSCCGCEDDCDLKKAVIEKKFSTVEQIISIRKYFGENYFLTRVEAEQALAKN